MQDSVTASTIMTNRQRSALSKKKHRDESRFNGKCSNCNRQAAPFRTKCSVCLYASKRTANRKLKRMMLIASGRCGTCGRPMDDDADAGYKNCINCRERGRTTSRRN